MRRRTLGLSRTLILYGILVGALLELFTMPLFGWLSDQVGPQADVSRRCRPERARAFPVFWLLDSRDPTIAC